MIRIGSTVVQQTKGGLAVELEEVRADDWGMNQDGTYNGTIIGERVYIAISTNILTAKQVQAIVNATSNKAGFYITFKHPSGTEKTLLFVKDGRQSWCFFSQARGIYTSTALVFVSKGVI